MDYKFKKALVIFASSNEQVQSDRPNARDHL